MDVGVEPPWMADICSSVIAHALPYYRLSMDIRNICSVGRFTACRWWLRRIHVLE